MSQPPYRPQGEPQPHWQQGQYPDYRQQGQPNYGQDPYGQDPYGQQRQPAQYQQQPAQQQRPQPPRPPQARPQQPAPPPRQAPSSSGFKMPGIGLILVLVGAAVSLLSLFLLPWAASGADTKSLGEIWDKVSNVGAHGFGDWYVLFSYPLVILGILLAFAAVLESVAMKVVWAGLMLLGLGYVVLRYGLGPFTGIFGADTKAGFSTAEIVLALGAVAVVVLVVFVLKTAVTMFRRVAGLALIGLSGVHLYAMADLVKAVDLSALSAGAFGPSVGYLLIGIAALIGPRRFIPGL